MSEPQLTEKQIASRRSLARWMAILGAVFLFFGLYVSAFLIPDVIQTASGPQSMPLTEAAQLANSEQTYARLENGTWDCDSLRQIRGFSPMYHRYDRLEEETKFTEVFYTDESREIVALVTLSGEVDCEDLANEKPSGYLYAMDSRTKSDLTRSGRLAPYTMSDSYLDFCGYCGRDNSLIGAAFGIFFTLCGLGLLIVAWNLRRKNRLAE